MVICINKSKLFKEVSFSNSNSMLEYGLINITYNINFKNEVTKSSVWSQGVECDEINEFRDETLKFLSLIINLK